MSFLSLTHKNWGMIMNSCYDDAGQKAREAMPDWTKIEELSRSLTINLRQELFVPCITVRAQLINAVTRDCRP